MPDYLVVHPTPFVLPGGRPVAPTETVSLPAEIADPLVERGRLVPAPRTVELEQLKRSALNQMAAELGVPDAEGLPTKAAVIDAIETFDPDADVDGDAVGDPDPAFAEE